MAIKIVPLAKAYPDGGYDGNEQRSHQFSEAGRQYLSTIYFLIVAGRPVHQWNYYVELPLMHQSLELLSKAIAAHHDHKFNSHAFGHNTLKIVSEYADRSAGFRAILESEREQELIRCLGEAWSAVRYGEAFVSSDAEDWHLFLEIAFRLANEFHSAKGQPSTPISGV